MIYWWYTCKAPLDIPHYGPHLSAQPRQDPSTTINAAIISIPIISFSKSILLICSTSKNKFLPPAAHAEHRGLRHHRHRNPCRCRGSPWFLILLVNKLDFIKINVGVKDDRHWHGGHRWWGPEEYDVENPHFHFCKDILFKDRSMKHPIHIIIWAP